MFCLRPWGFVEIYVKLHNFFIILYTSLVTIMVAENKKSKWLYKFLIILHGSMYTHVSGRNTGSFSIVQHWLFSIDCCSNVPNLVKFVNYFWRYSKNLAYFFWRRCRKPVSLAMQTKSTCIVTTIANDRHFSHLRCSNGRSNRLFSFFRPQNRNFRNRLH